MNSNIKNQWWPTSLSHYLTICLLLTKGISFSRLLCIKELSIFLADGSPVSLEIKFFVSGKLALNNRSAISVTPVSRLISDVFFIGPSLKHPPGTSHLASSKRVNCKMTGNIRISKFLCHTAWGFFFVTLIFMPFFYNSRDEICLSPIRSDFFLCRTLRI